ncbi:MAG: hypothetical protein RQ729_03160 [Wenzhouxiangellaceae bacterium]|nr:hypothetical protein [Wenzhouxiangellaceae bacterium]
MKFKGLTATGIAAALAAAGIANAGLQLQINGDKLTGPDGLVKFEYQPGSKTLTLQSFFQDLRCEPNEQVTGSFNLVLDQMNPVEGEARYQIPSDAIISYSVTPEGEKVISINSASILKPEGETVRCEHVFPIHGLIQADGTPERDTFVLGDFEQIFEVKISRPTDQVGFDVTLSNKDAFFVGRDLAVAFTATSSPQPTFHVDEQNATITTRGWLVPELWPGQSVTLNIRYQDIISGTVTLSIDEVETLENRFESLPSPFITVVNTSTSQVVG